MERKSNNKHPLIVEGGVLVGRIIASKYSVQSIIGQGAMGVVYRAKQIALDKVVALKVLGDELRDDPEFVLRFHTEARAASRLDHPNSTRVIDFGEEPDGLLYIAMELLVGRTLAEVVEQEWPLAPARTASIASQVLSAVGAAHALGILHRDLKPENIIILEGRDDEERPIDVVKVCDFGIAKVEGLAEPSDGASRREILDTKSPATPKLKNATRAGVIIGTPQYMSPEQARGEKLDVRSDVYSLGIVLYEMLTSRAPFDEGTAAEVLLAHTNVEPTKPSEIYRGVDPALEEICLRALRKQREDRFATAREMRIALRPLLDPTRASLPREPTSAPMVMRPRDTSTPTMTATAVPLPPKPRRSWLLYAAAPLAVAGLGAYAIMSFARHEPAARRTSAVAALAQTQTPTPTPTQTQTLARVLAPTSTATSAGTTATSEPAIHGMRRVAATAPITTSAPLETTTVALPPPVETVAPPPPPPTAVTLATTSAPPPAVITVQHADPARVHVDIGQIQADRVGAASVDTALRHVDFTGCYRTEVTAQRETDGTATLVVEMDEERITRADLAGGAFSSSLRQCISQRTLGTRIRSADTGGATARVTLRFALK